MLDCMQELNVIVDFFSRMSLLILTFYFLDRLTASLLYRAAYVICDGACYFKLYLSFSWKTQLEL
jgi:hypothetical protein